MADVVVVGAGIIGLTTAIRLQQAGAEVEVWSADDPAHIVSGVAAAVWYPTRIAAGADVLRWAGDTYAEFRRQIGDGAPGTLMRRTRNLHRERLAELPWWTAAAGGVDLRDSFAPYAQEVVFDAPLAEMDAYLRWLGGRVAVVRKRVTGLDDVTSPVIVNATGIAARELCRDDAVEPARGHVVIVENPGLDVSIRDVGGDTYIHPRTRDVVLGGTFGIGEWDTGPDPAEARAIVERCVALEPKLADARVLQTRIGLRPVRRGGPRVELETRPDGRRIVHNYGHGGAGMTLSWGCADEVVRLVTGLG